MSGAAAERIRGEIVPLLVIHAPWLAATLSGRLPREAPVPQDPRALAACLATWPACARMDGTALRDIAFAVPVDDGARLCGVLVLDPRTDGTTRHALAARIEAELAPRDAQDIDWIETRFSQDSQDP